MTSVCPTYGASPPRSEGVRASEVQSREAIAKIIYDAFPFSATIGAPHKPEWVPGGNGIRQSDARSAADKILALGAAQRSEVQNEDMARLSASEVACYRWPEDTAEHRAMREAFCDGAAQSASIHEQIIHDLTDGITGTLQKDEMERLRNVAQASKEQIAFINRRLEDLAEANAIYGKDQRLNAPDKIARNDREISWLKDLRSMILISPSVPSADGGPAA